ncbi:uncharacterized protein LOC105829362 [Monomorium pharaonis]|uniref:uncharacterized protein LOC105829362 n=1 Tax=Monomorium pharaonis TaxID=307658 RepID=UPI00063FA185|nr:uncharacterized protein LOC105829362 [Monomorium pharaonis]XP_036149254.1 uncharacterized protein LOC105829362 [Monomorium pharaonis]
MPRSRRGGRKRQLKRLKRRLLELATFDPRVFGVPPVPRIVLTTTSVSGALHPKTTGHIASSGVSDTATGNGISASADICIPAGNSQNTSAPATSGGPCPLTDTHQAPADSSADLANGCASPIVPAANAANNKQRPTAHAI